MERRTIRAADLGIGGNEAAARELKRKGVRTVSVLPQLGLDPDCFYPRQGPKSDVFTIGYAGRLVKEKGVDRLLCACAGLGGAWRLKLLGSGPEAKFLRGLSGKLGVSGRVEFLPAVPHAAVADFLREIDVLVLPSVAVKGWAEQFGHVLIEAMSAALPVAASKSGSIPEVVGDAGLLFPEGDVPALQKILANLQDDPKLAEALGVRGRERVLERFSWERIAGRTAEIYRSLLDGEAAGPPPHPAEPGRTDRP
jgi:glycosyltransferase involved in cell wall biosynthesis